MLFKPAHAETYQEEQHRIAVQQADKYFSQMQQQPTGNHSIGIYPSYTTTVTNSINTGSRIYNMPSGSYIVSHAGSQTFVIQTSKSK